MLVRQPRATQRYRPAERDDEKPLTKRIIGLAAAYGRYGYRRITALLRREGWRVNHKRVERIWRREGLMATRGVPEHIRSDNGPEIIARAVRSWLKNVGVKTLFIKPGSLWENGYCESLNGKLRDELRDPHKVWT